MIPGIVSVVTALCLMAIAVEPTFATPIAGGVAVVSLLTAVLLRREWVSTLCRRAPILMSLLLLLGVGVLSAVWAAGGADPVLDRAVKLTVFLILAGSVAVAPFPGRYAVPVAVGAAFGAGMIALALIDNRLLGSLQSYFVPQDASHFEAVFIRSNLHKVPAVLLVLILFPILLWASGLRTWRGRAFGWGCAALSILGLLGSGHVTALLAVAAALGVALLGAWLPRLTVGLIGGVLIIMTLAVPHILQRADLSPLLSATYFSSSLQHRVMIADYAAARIDERPLLGWGLDGARSVPGGSDLIQETPSRHDRFDVDELHSAVWAKAQNLPLHPHNISLQTRLELGIGGSVALILFVVASLREAVILPTPLMRATAFGTVSGGLAIGSVSFGMWQSWWLAVLILTAALLRAALSASMRLRGAS